MTLKETDAARAPLVRSERVWRAETACESLQLRAILQTMSGTGGASTLRRLLVAQN
jgi:hypothetical protein